MKFIKYLLLFIALSLVSLFLIDIFQKPTIELLCRDNKTNGIKETYLIKNHPKSKAKLEMLMYEFNKDLDSLNPTITRHFIKEHNNRGSIIPLPFPGYINYSETGCEEIDIMDILYRVDKYNTYNEKDTITYRFMY